MKLRARGVVGLLLIIAGGLLLLQSMDILTGSTENVIWTVVFGFFGFLFTSMFFSKRRQWWWIIPGITLLALMTIHLLETFAPKTSELYSGVIILGGLGLSFVMVYFRDRMNWWTLIPGGVLITLGLVTLQDEFRVLAIDSGAIFFFGLGITFFILFLIPTPYGRLKWAIYPPIILLLLGTFLAFGTDERILNAVGPIIIVLFGFYILYNSFKKR